MRFCVFTVFSVSDIILEVKPGNYSLFAGFVHLGAGLACGFTGMAAGYAIGIVGDSVSVDLQTTEKTYILINIHSVFELI